LQPDVLEGITAQIRQTILSEGTPLAAAYYCPHTHEENCDCRKSEPGLLYKVADDFNVDLSRSIFIGDSDTNVQAAQAVRCKPVLYGSGLSDSSRLSGWSKDLPTALTATNLFDVVVKCQQTTELSALDDHPIRSSERWKGQASAVDCR